MNDPEKTATATATVRAALDTTRRVLPAYLVQMIAQRADGPDACGSYYPGRGPMDLDAALSEATWRPYAHPDVMSGCDAFRAELPGVVGVVAAAALPSDARIVLADPKATGNVEATVAPPVGWDPPTAEFTVLIVGEDDGHRVVFTFHPGAPIAPSHLRFDGNAGRVVTPAEALELGFTHAKVVAR
jgi:hypothetical protein